jgi:hypothetical protein
MSNVKAITTRESEEKITLCNQGRPADGKGGGRLWIIVRKPGPGGIRQKKLQKMDSISK